MSATTQTPAPSPPKHRVARGGVGLLLASAIALNIAALASTAWLREKPVSVSTRYPVALLDDNATRTFSREDLEPASPDGYARYEGMRAGTFQLCYTLTDASKTPSVAKEQCMGYHAEHRRRAASTPAAGGAFVLDIESPVCSIPGSSSSLSSLTLRSIGIPNDVLPEFLGGFCGLQRVVAALQILASVAAFVGVVSWLQHTRAEPANQRKLLVRVVWAAGVGAVLTLTTYGLWMGSFATIAGVSPGSSAHCTVASGALLVTVSAVTWYLQRCEQPGAKNNKPSPREPLV